MKKALICTLASILLVLTATGVQGSSSSPNHKKIVYLTLDGGPSPEFSAIVLPIFREHNCRVTWFVVGEHLMKDITASRALVEAGHEVEVHGWLHRDWTKLSDDQLRLEVQLTGDIIELQTGERPRFTRPPYGAHNVHSDAIVRKLGYQIVMWDVDYPDFQAGASVTKLVDGIAAKVRPGSVVLLHVTRLTWKALPVLLTRLDKMGYEYGLLKDRR